MRAEGWQLQTDQSAMANIRNDFKSHAQADPVTAGKLIAAGQKELKALRALLNNEHLKKFPGPPVPPTTHCCMLWLHAEPSPCYTHVVSLPSVGTDVSSQFLTWMQCLGSRQMIEKLHRAKD